MPIERRSSSAQIRSILIGVVTLVFVVTLGYAVFRAATGQQTSVSSTGGDGRWNAGTASSKAKLIRSDGPILIPDPAGAQRLPIYISHVGKADDTGWYAFEARPPGESEDCFIDWDKDAALFRTKCNDDTYPANGEGLQQFGTSVTKAGDLVIDFTPAAATSTTATDG